KQQHYLETARRSAETLLGIINGILDISKIESGKIELEQSPFDLRELVEDVTETFSDAAFGKGLELACFVPASLSTALVGDAARRRHRPWSQHRQAALRNDGRHDGSDERTGPRLDLPLYGPLRPAERDDATGGRRSFGTASAARRRTGP